MQNSEKQAQIITILKKSYDKDASTRILTNFWISLVQANINLLEEDYNSLKLNSQLFQEILSTQKITDYNLGTFLRHIEINIYNEMKGYFPSLDACIITINSLFHLYDDPSTAISYIKKSNKSIVCLNIKMLIINQDLIADIYQVLNPGKNSEMFVE